MAKHKKENPKAEENLASVEEALSKTEQFIDNNKNTLLYSVLGIAVLVLAVMGYQRYVILPNERQAQEEMFKAEMYFEQDSLELALYGDGAYLGFLDIIDEYKRTKSGNLAQYYAGVCFLKLGEFDQAIAHLKKFDSDDEMILPMAYGNLGNAYMEKGELETAANYYKDAVDASENRFTAPEYLFRLGLTYEMLDNYDKAKQTYESIRKEYPNSRYGREIEKYIARVETKIS
ncbi:MAG: tetratricopeptide repeat protein [Bacteroidales bacterium]